MTSSDDVPGFGWELHDDSGSSDKFYRLIVVTGPEPLALGLHGSRGQSGQIGLLRTGITAKEALNEVVKKSREKERKGYEASREFTVFHVPASIAGPNSAKDNAREIARYFGKYASQAGTELPNASYIPTV
ncbi:WGR domain-containing protein [Streptomyces sp. NBC_01142]|uniref:WGR domain-containing protein n=1 Tax=Streptomyces sp. NBC_01142 TaxID=2975865 RepID=UPI00224FCAD2|nr:WGR domain-containing protein [Streptomyces sp. NBC_01142]MCX4826761.1 WGR domain-containing protein [Streptomyces sp. NBC_01142]